MFNLGDMSKGIQRHSWEEISHQHENGMFEDFFNNLKNTQHVHLSMWIIFKMVFCTISMVFKVLAIRDREKICQNTNYRCLRRVLFSFFFLYFPILNNEYV